MNFLFLFLSLCITNSNKPNIEITSIDSENRRDCYPIAFKNGIVFNSYSITSDGSPSRRQDLHFSEIIDGQNLRKPKRIKIRGYYDTGAEGFEFCKATGEVFVTARNGHFNKMGHEGFSLFVGNLDNGVIKNLKILPFCAPASTCSYATLSNDGKYMIFVANDTVNGKQQLYENHRTSIKSEWSTPTLIKEFENFADVFYPNLVNDSLIVYSAWMRTGMGGLDFYTSKKTNGKWGVPENWAALNSEYNEAGLDMVDENSGYFASNRTESPDDDKRLKIYYFKFNK